MMKKDAVIITVARCSWADCTLDTAATTFVTTTTMNNNNTISLQIWNAVYSFNIRS